MKEMSEDEEQQIAAFLEMWIGGIPKRTRFFDEENMKPLADNHRIPEDTKMWSLLLLEIAALSYWKEKERAKTDFAEARKKLGQLEKALTRLVQALDGLDQESRRVIYEARVARRLSDRPFADLVGSAVQRILQPRTADLDGQKTWLDEAQRLEDFRNSAAAIGNDAQGAQKWAGKGRSGRRDDDSAKVLIQFCFMVWTNFVKRDFKLAWYKQHPDSDAARFCVDVAAMVDPKLTTSRIISASRKVREENLNISDLQKLTAEAEEFRKRMD